MNDAQRLHQFFAGEWEYALQTNPFRATRTGDSRYDALIPDGSREGLEKKRAHAVDALARLQRINRNRLDDTGRLNYDLYEYNLTTGIEGFRFPAELMPVTQMGGVYDAGVAIARMAPKRTVENFEDMLARLRQVPRMVRWTTEFLRRGAGAGITPPRVTLEKVGDLIGNQLVDDPRQSPVFTTAFKDVDSSITEQELARLQDECARVISDSILPAVAAFRTYWTEEYFPAARRTLAFTDLPDGDAWYRHLIKTQTTLDMTADEIHALGLAEVDAVTGQMEAVKKRAGFARTLDEFKDYLYRDPRFFRTSAESLLRDARDIGARIDPQLPRLFGRLPALPYKIEPVPAHSAVTAPAAYYMAGNVANSRPGVFYVNTCDLPSRPVWQLEVLVAHEAVPGHHLQIALAEELRDVPEFRRYVHYGSYTEGWGLYAESLGFDLGLYESPYSDFGRLSLAMWRAVRLVVDTGLHAKGWTRERAVAYFEKHTGKTRYESEVEIDRYLVWPAQALTYKLGERVFSELRRNAEAALGDAFVLREFHDMVLGGGAVPLPLLRERAERWVAAKKGKSDYATGI